MPDPLTTVTMYADGAASPNPGTGGYGIVLVIDGRRRELSGGFRRTTNNRMELMGVIVGLRTLQSARYDVTIYSDSKYVVDMFAGGYATAWRRNGWTRNHGRDPVLNPDLWGELLDLAAGHKVQFVWVRGHSDNMENTRCDEMAVQARQAKDLPVDAGYEKTITPAQPSQLLLFGFP